MTTGHLELILGPMFAGKTTELIKCINRYKHITKKYFLVNHVHDTRYENNSIVEHNEISKFKTTHTTDKLMSLLVDDDFNNTQFQAEFGCDAPYPQITIGTEHVGGLKDTLHYLSKKGLIS